LPNWDLKIFGPAGGVLSNVKDLSKYAVANFDKTNKELLLSRNKTFKINKKRSVGLGWFILKSSSYKKRIYTHSGNTSGYSSFIGINTYNKNGIILLSNVSGFNPNLEKLNALGFKLLKNLKKN
jgi:CubicO group peptidase (beta-lactamase class C family)